MNRAQELLLEMFDEVRTICEENGLTMFLFTNTALAAYRIGGFDTERYVINICMPWKDVVRFQQIIEERKPAGRTVESLYSNPDIANLVFRYVNTNTTRVNKKVNIRAKELGLCINLWPMFSRECEEIKNTADMGLIAKLRYKTVERKSRSMRKQSLSVMDKGIKKLRKGKPLGEKGSASFLDHISDLQKDATLADTFYIRRYNSLNEANYPTGLFLKTMEVQFEGRTCRIPEDVDTFFSAQYNDWKNKELKTDNDLPRYEVVDTDLPYRKYLAYMEEHGLEEYIDCKMYYGMGKKLKQANQYVDDAWNIVLRTAARINLWDWYMPLKPQIMELHDQGNWDELQKLMAEYDDTMRQMEEVGLAVYFDEDLFNILCELRERNGDHGASERLRAMIPGEHLKPVKIG